MFNETKVWDMTERKYTDRDVHENPDLHRLAYEYLRQYKGSFHFLVGANDLLNDIGDLPVPVIRGVLNCMRADSTVRNMPEPKPHRFDASGFDSFDVPAIRVRRKRKKLPAFVAVTARSKFPFTTSTYWAAEKIHMVLDRPGANYWDNTFYSRQSHEIEVKLYNRCGGQLNPKTAVLLTPDQALELIVGGERRYCQTCEYLMGKDLLMSTLTDYPYDTTELGAFDL